LIFPVINEGFKILEEGFAFKPSDVDMVCVFGYNFPKTKGGPMHFGGQVGLLKLLERLRFYRGLVSTKNAAYWKPSQMLEECVVKNLSPDQYLKASAKL